MPAEYRLPIRVGLIGFGLAGQVFHAPLISATDEMSLAYIVTSNRERQLVASQRYPAATLLELDDELFGVERPDLIVIATTNDAHKPLALRAIESGIAVVVDKPLAISSAEADLIVQAA